MKYIFYHFRSPIKTFEKNITLSLLFLVFLPLSFTQSKSNVDQKLLPPHDAFTKLGTIQIIPLGNVDNKIINEVKYAINHFYGRPVKLLNKVPLSNDLKRTSKSRYSAELILNKFNSNIYTIVVTEADITIWNKIKKQDWGIFGYAKEPGKVCVISAYKKRLGKNISNNGYSSRIRKVTIHEIGHNLNLNHCSNQIDCVMHAANGSAVQIDKEKEDFCTFCKSKLK